jgi:hypothetical protein
MAKAFYHRGLTIEFDAQIPRLTVDGQEIPPPDLSRLPANTTDVLIEYAREFVNASRDLTERDSNRDEHLERLRSGTDRWNEWRRQNPAVRPLLYDAELSGIDLTGRIGINLANANMICAHLIDAKLIGANFHEANLGGANLSHAKLARANFCRTDLYETNLTHADLEGANLQGTQLAKTDFTGACLLNCRIYGLSAWDITVDEETTQKDLVIVYEKPTSVKDAPLELGRVVVDDLRVAQFIYLILHNENIRYVLETTSRKAVLILGRFSEDRKPVLEAIRGWLREKDFIPVLFDFDNPSKDFGETIRILAGMSRFVIADLTDPRSVPMELEMLVKNYRIPFVPIVEKRDTPFSMFRDLHWHWWLLKEVKYSSIPELLRNLDEMVMKQVSDTEKRLLAERVAAAS